MIKAFQRYAELSFHKKLFGQLNPKSLFSVFSKFDFQTKLNAGKHDHFGQAKVDVKHGYTSVAGPTNSRQKFMKSARTRSVLDDDFVQHEHGKTPVEIHKTPQHGQVQQKPPVPWMTFLFLLSMVGYIQFLLWSSNGSFDQIAQLERDISSQRSQNEQLLDRNQLMVAEIMELKSGMATVEERARFELGMIKNGESLYQLTR